MFQLWENYCLVAKKHKLFVHWYRQNVKKKVAEANSQIGHKFEFGFIYVVLNFSWKFISVLVLEITDFGIGYDIELASIYQIF